ncbi:aromatic amino acid exporter YddG [Streptomyces turgidiscabies]|uniref:Drug/metabolite transporter (DMT)-like permease n=1 Tax=Streptomyces turgidiscabies TaxID=85558 RepID=A0ABU0RT05_9ACTN|nr:EamA family transporter [Streptomyces turgidiscabies]MDQ0934858.1 drug/metabolite transporter (DMT)-like permease [Streptomyces turgidiscabies]
MDAQDAQADVVGAVDGGNRGHGQGGVTDPARRLRATGVGATAVLLWASLALFTTLTGRIPPFQLTAMAFAVGGIIGLPRVVRNGGALARGLPGGAWALGIGGLFGYHFFYFLALRNAPAVDAGLIAYLWPLLIVVFSALLPGERLRWWHAAGAVLGLCGTFLLVTGGHGVHFRGEYLLGYAAAGVCALVWSAYSVANRRYPQVPTDMVAFFCLATAALAAVCHLLFETTVRPDGWQWLAVLALGLGPVGGAFYVWDHGTKRGDIRLLGTLAYFAPLLSTALLVATGRADGSWPVAVACVLITGGALLASADALRAARRRG